MSPRVLMLLTIAVACLAWGLHKCGIVAWVRAQRPPAWLTKYGDKLLPFALAAFCFVAAVGLPSLPSLPAIQWPAITWPSVAPAKATAATYVYEKDLHAIPAPVMAALNTLNREGIIATIFEQDTLDGDGQVPDQYKVPLAAAKEAGLPSLVVTGGDKVIRIVQAPTTEAAVLEAVK